MPSIFSWIAKTGKGLCYLGLILSLCLISACTSRGVAPVYSRGVSVDRLPETGKRPGSYRVRTGDTLYSIAWRYRVDYHLLAAWNRIKGPSYRIYPGQWLRLQPPALTQGSKRKSKNIPRRPVTSTGSPPAGSKTVQPPDPRTIQINKQRPNPEKLKLGWRWPTNGKVIQSFSASDPARKGIKISGISGQSVLAAESGKVVYSGSGLVGYGNLIIIKHNNNYLSAYGYNKRLLVKEGDKVSKGERIAQMGSPRNDMDPVLHFEIRKLGKPLDPLTLLPKK